MVILTKNVYIGMGIAAGIIALAFTNIIPQLQEVVFRQIIGGIILMLCPSNDFGCIAYTFPVIIGLVILGGVIGYYVNKK